MANWREWIENRIGRMTRASAPSRQASGSTPTEGSEETRHGKSGVAVLAVSKNEQVMMPFFLTYYLNFVGADRITIYDGNSTDDTLAIIRRFQANYPDRIELIIDDHPQYDERNLMRIRNEAWKANRHSYDWQIVCDIDEFLYHPRLHDKLRSYRASGVTVPFIMGFDMHSLRLPEYADDIFLPQEIQCGVYTRNLDKRAIFDPAVVDINYDFGCHAAHPTGVVKESRDSDLRLMQYRWVSHDHLIAKSSDMVRRFSAWSIEHRMAYHNEEYSRTVEADFIARFRRADNIFNPVSRPAFGRKGLEPALDLLFDHVFHPVIVEVGCQRAFHHTHDGASTSLFSWYVNRYGGSLYSVDIDQGNVDLAKREIAKMKLLGDNVRIVCADGIEFIKTFNRRIDLLYLDAWDQLGDDGALRLSEEKHLECFRAAEPLLGDGALILINDVKDAQTFEGKGRLLIPYLLQRGYRIIHQSDQCLLVHAGTAGA